MKEEIEVFLSATAVNPKLGWLKFTSTTKRKSY